MHKLKKLLFVINPIAGTKAKGSIPEIIANHIDKKMFLYDIAITKRKGHARILAQRARTEGFDFVIAVGGDGTVSEVAGGLVNDNTALGILPLGSGNGLARHLRIPLGTADAINVINQQNIITIDSGTINDKPFFCTAGVGFDAHIGKVFSEQSVRGFCSYVKLTLKEFRKYHTHDYVVEIGDESINLEAFTITFANAAQYGNKAYISPNADIQDGKLDLCILRPFPKYWALDLGVRLFTKKIHKSRYMKVIPIKKVRITTTDVDCLHLDGEHERLKKQTLSVKVIPSSLNILSPLMRNSSIRY